MVSWREFHDEAPTVAETFVRRHAATGKLCLLGTNRSDGFPRLVLVGMPGTTKFRDLGRDPRFNLHTATVDAYVGDGDAKLWGLAHNLQDPGLHARFAEDLYEDSGMDLRGQAFDPFFVADLTGGSSIEFTDNELVITIWRPGEGERTVRKT